MDRKDCVVKFKLTAYEIDDNGCEIINENGESLYDSEDEKDGAIVDILDFDNWPEQVEHTLREARLGTEYSVDLNEGAFGEWSDDLVFEVPTQCLTSPKVGEEVEITIPSDTGMGSMKMNGIIDEVGADVCYVDCNHPWCDIRVRMYITVIGRRASSDMERLNASQGADKLTY